MGVQRIVALVAGCLLAALGMGMLAAGVGVQLADVKPDADGFVTTTKELDSATAAIVTDDVTFRIDSGTPAWITDALDTGLRVRVVESETEVFVGVASTDDVDRWLADVAHSRLEVVAGQTNVVAAGGPQAVPVPPPTDQDFWVASNTAGSELDWSATNGHWTAVVANADGTPGVAATLDVGVRIPVLGPLAGILLVVGGLATATAAVLLVWVARGEPAAPSAARPMEKTRA